MLDIAIIGAGPCALAFLSRLASKDRDDSLDFMHGFDSAVESLKQTRDRLCARRKMAAASGSSSSSVSCLEGRVKVFDATGEFMGKWNHLFDCLDIQYLRSPHTMHPGPSHTMSLLAHAREGVDTSSSGDDVPQFQDLGQLHFKGCHRAPSTQLFASFCADLVASHDLDRLLQKAVVEKVEVVYEEKDKANTKEDSHHFRLHIRSPLDDTTTGGGGTTTTVVLARAVVFATGSTSRPRLPDWMKELRGHQDYAWAKSNYRYPPYALRHAFELPTDMTLAGEPKPSIGPPIAVKDRILIIGGGLTSVQLAVTAAKAGCQEVVLLCRHALIIKQFDVASDWMDWHKRPALLKGFYDAGMGERLGLLRKARGQASIPPEAYALLLQHDSAIKIVENTQVFQCPRWNDPSNQWRVGLQDLSTGRITEESFSRIWCATGSELDMASDPILHSLLEQLPINTDGGLPRLTPWLSWDEHCEFYVLGALAGLVLGPDAQNLMGARTGACRAAAVLQHMVRSDDQVSGEEEMIKLLRKSKDQVAALRFSYDSTSGRVKPHSTTASMLNNCFLEPQGHHQAMEEDQSLLLPSQLQQLSVSHERRHLSRFMRKRLRHDWLRKKCPRASQEGRKSCC